MVAFYEKLLGKPADMVDPDNGFWGWQVGNVFLGILNHSEMGGKSKDAGRIMLNFETPQVKEEFERIKAIGAKKVAIVAPYMMPLTEMVVNYIRSEGIEVAEWRALEISDNLAVAAHDPARLPGIVASMEQIGDVDAVVLSACVQMPSLPAVSIVEAQVGKPVLTAAIATTWAMLKSLDLDTRVPGGGTLLSGAY
mgnify:CR=1 FL=1